MCYGNILGSDIKIPTQPGCEFTLDQLPNKRDLSYGFYRVKITTDNKDFNKCFTFSKHNVYVELSLKFAMKYKKKFDVIFELIMDGEPNAYLYNEDDVVSLNSMTYMWHEKVSAKSGLIIDRVKVLSENFEIIICFFATRGRFTVPMAKSACAIWRSFSQAKISSEKKFVISEKY